MSELIIIIGIVLIAVIVLWLLTWRNERSWDTPSPPITPTPKEKESVDSPRCDRIIDYLNQVDAQIQQSRRVDKTEVREMLFKLKNRWKIIYYDRLSKAARAAGDRDNLEVKLMDKGIDLKYPN